MRRRSAQGEIRRRVPRGRELPAAFEVLLQAKPPFALEWNSLAAFGFKRSAATEAIPFLRLSDGGLIAFWFYSSSPAIVYVGHDGELQVIAHCFECFLKAINARTTALSEIDEAEPRIRVPGVKGGPSRAGVKVLQKRLEAWAREHTALRDPAAGPDVEKLRKLAIGIAREMIRDGKSKVYTSSSRWWNMEFRIERTGEKIEVNYLDFGKWYPVPRKYNLAETAFELIQLAKNRKRKHYGLSICSAGVVSLDKDRELVLVKPSKVT